MNEIDQNNFIKEFKAKLETTKNKEYLIQNEINQIEAFTTTIGESSMVDVLGVKSNITNSVFDLRFLGSRTRFNKIFVEYLLGEKDELSENELTHPHLKLIYEQAKYFAEYYSWLKELKVPKSREKFSDLNNEQKLLALHYLFPNLSNYTQTQLSKVLSQILNIGSENIRRNLSALYKNDSEIRTIENYEKLIELFENKTFETITNKLKKEINQMS